MRPVVPAASAPRAHTEHHPVRVGCRRQEVLTGGSAETKVPTSERRQVPTGLVGSWTVTSPLQPGGAQVILGDVLTVFLPCGLVDGSWLADSSGAFVGDLNSGDEACFNGIWDVWRGEAAEGMVTVDLGWWPRIGGPRSLATR